jgi:hypothetical protein
VIGGREVLWSGVEVSPMQGRRIRSGATLSDAMRQLAKQSELPSSGDDVICSSGAVDGILGTNIITMHVVVK